jgi:hypothetical protein
MAQRDTEFWFVAPEVLGQDAPIYLRLAAYADPTTITVRMPANPSFTPVTITLSPYQAGSIPFPVPAVVEDAYTNTPGNFGLLITGTKDFSAYYDMMGSSSCSLCNPEIFPLKGRKALGTRFRIPMQKKYDRGTGYGSIYSAFDIVATEETDVTITPSIAIRNHAASVPFTVHLLRGQTYSCASISGTLDASNNPSGSLVVSDRPVAITVKDDKVQMYDPANPAAHGEDLIGDQIVPENALGTDYITVSNSSNDYVTIVPIVNGTSITINGVPMGTANAGQSIDTPIAVTGTGYHIQTSSPAYVVHTTGHAGEAGAALLPTIRCTGSRNVIVNRANDREFTITLMTEDIHRGTFNVYINGTLSTFLINSSDFDLVAPPSGVITNVTNGAWYTARISIPLSVAPVNSSIRVENTAGIFHMGVINGDISHTSSTSGSSYGYFSDYSSLSLEVTSKAGCDSACNGAITVHVSQAFDPPYTYVWNTLATTPTIENLCVGMYTVTVSSQNECTAEASVYLDNSEVDDAYIIASGCFNTNIGTLTVNGITHTAGYDYTWSTGQSGVSSITNLGPGNYSVIVTDSTGCGDTLSITIAPYTTSVTLTTQSGSCDTACSGSIRAIIQGGASPFSYHWTGPSGPLADTPYISHLCAGYYNVTVIDARGCTVFADTAITGTDSIYGELIVPDTLCIGSSSQIIARGNGFAQFIFNDIDTFGITLVAGIDYIFPATASPADLGTAKVCLVLFSGDPTAGGLICSDTICKTVALVSCGCDSLAGKATLVTNNEGNMKYEFYNGGSVEASFINWIVDGVQIEQTPGHYSFRHQFTQGTHEICMEAAYILPGKDGHNICCYYKVCDTIKIDVCEYWKANDAIKYEPGSDYHNINFAFYGNTTPVPTVIWNFGDGGKEVNDGTPISHYYTTAGTYDVCAYVIWSHNGTWTPENPEVCCCVDTICFSVEVNPCNTAHFTVSSENLNIAGSALIVSQPPVPYFSIVWSRNDTIIDTMYNTIYMPYTSPYSGYQHICAEVSYTLPSDFPGEPQSFCTTKACAGLTFTYTNYIKPKGLMKYFPNPVNSIVTIDVMAIAGNSTEIVITDQLGVPIKTKRYDMLTDGLNQLYIAADDLITGIYLMKVTVDGNSKTVKLVKD